MTEETIEATEQQRLLEPLADRIIVKIVKDPEMTEGGIVLPDSVRERSQRGIVVAVGPGRWESGGYVPLDLAVGDVVLFSKYGGTELPEGLSDREPLLVLREMDVLTKERMVDAPIPDAEEGADLMDAPPPGGDMYPGGDSA
jgi:chaperonin GroES